MSREMSRKGSSAVEVWPHAQHMTSDCNRPPKMRCSALSASSAPNNAYVPNTVISCSEDLKGLHQPGWSPMQYLRICPHRGKAFLLTAQCSEDQGVRYEN